MKPETLELLTCPHCHGALRLRGDASKSIESGTLACDTCSQEFPIEEGIPHFIRYEELTGLNRRFARLYDWFSYFYFPVSKLAYGLIGLLYALLLALLRNRAERGQPLLTASELENTVFVQSLAWFPWYFILTMVIMLVYAWWKLKDSQEHKQIG